MKFKIWYQSFGAAYKGFGVVHSGIFIFLSPTKTVYEVATFSGSGSTVLAAGGETPWIRVDAGKFGVLLNLSGQSVRIKSDDAVIGREMTKLTFEVVKKGPNYTVFDDEVKCDAIMSSFDMIGAVQKVEDFGDNEMLEQLWRTSKKLIY